MNLARVRQDAPDWTWRALRNFSIGKDHPLAKQGFKHDKGFV